jgi:hypothetical protein
MPTSIRTCHCNNRYQDETYGKDKRVFNQMGSTIIHGWRCTSCGDKSNVESGEAKAKTKPEKK